MISTRCQSQFRLGNITRIITSRRLYSSIPDISRPLQSYISTSSDPFLNLSIEHHLLQRTPPDSRILLLYINRPCVVIGRNQNPWTEVNLSLLRRGLPLQFPTTKDHNTDNANDRVPIDLVRRRSGGGTVFHDAGNVNWTIICPSAHFTRDMHAEMVVRALRRLGVANSRVNERHDIVLDLPPEGAGVVAEVEEGDTHSTRWTGKGRAVKVSGSAYKLTRGRALHHGTALCQSPNLGVLGRLLKAPGKELISSRGVESVSSPVANIGVAPKDFTRAVQREFGRLYGSEEAVEEVGEDWLGIEEVKKGWEELKTSDWIYGQTPRFEISNEKDEEVTRGKKAKMLLRFRGGAVEAVEAESVHTGLNVRIRDRIIGMKLHELLDWRSGMKASGKNVEAVELLAWLDGFAASHDSSDGRKHA